MSVQVGTGLPLRIEDLPEGDGPRTELVDGSLHVTPLAGPQHQDLVFTTCALLRAATPAQYRALPGANVLRRGSTDRLLIPDVVVVEATVLGEQSAYVDPSDVLLVVEVESPSTRSVDRVLKRELYAQWRVPGYWIVDPDVETVTRLVLTAERTYVEGAGPVPWLADVDTTALFD
ncbi:Uma2 family endonuclease [Kineococcus terrestris]|uniref:Uma2 family endonuclease n=1 Tax=Kineococcus terrestris TaxID=2044856 RepID=UPI0034DB0658